MPQLDLYTYLFGEFTVGYSFILLYSLFLLILFKFWALFFQNNDFRFNTYVGFNFFKNLYYNNIFNFFKATLNAINGSNKNKLNIVINIFFLKEYASLLLYLLTAFVISSLLFFIANYLNDKFLYKEKVSSYECGFEPFSDARAQVNIHFYIVGLLFVIFDVEVIYFLPWACNLGSLGAMGYFSILIFNFFLIGGFIYEMNRGVFDWSSAEQILSPEDKLKIVAAAFPEMNVVNENVATNVIDTERNSKKKLEKKNLLVSFENFYRLNKLFIISLLVFFVFVFVYFYILESILLENCVDFNDFFFDRRDSKPKTWVKKRPKVRVLFAKRLTIIAVPHKLRVVMNPRLFYTDKYIIIHKHIHVAGVIKLFIHWIWTPILKPIMKLLIAIFFFFFDLINHDFKIRLFSICAFISLGTRFVLRLFFEDECVIRYSFFSGEELDFFNEYFYGLWYMITIVLLYAWNFPGIKECSILPPDLYVVLEFYPSG